MLKTEREDKNGREKKKEKERNKRSYVYIEELLFSIIIYGTKKSHAN